MGYQQLLAARPRDLKPSTRAEIQKGVLRSSFLRGPGGCYMIAGSQPAGSSQHYIPDVPITAQFPPEILLKVLGHLDPIWLFQAEAACSHIRSLLRSPAGNIVWYNAIPGALLTQPEYFQSEREVRNVLNQDGSQVYSVNAIDHSQAYLNSEVQVDDIMTTYLELSLPSSFQFTLPALREVSGLWDDVDTSCGTHHPQRKYLDQYPYVKARSYPRRKRTLALGGPFDTSISYRRELLGHLHYNAKCYICYESFNNFRSRVQRFGMTFCEQCLTSLTVEPISAQKIPDLLLLLERAGDGPWEPGRFSLAATEGLWLPRVDDILRNFIGVDYGTAIAKQQYFEYLYAATSPEVDEGLRATKRDARALIVEEAKKLWGAPKGFAKAVLDGIDSMRRTFAPTDKLSEFLFPDRDLHVEALYLPHDVGASWMEDHMDRLENVEQVRSFMQSPDRIVETARTMVSDLVQTKDRVTTLVQAAHEWHVDRLSATLTLEQLLGPAPGTRGYRGARFKVILEKLHLVYDDVTCGILLTPEGEEKAKKVLAKITGSSCTACPKTHLLAPRGIHGIVSHVRERHRDMFWYGKFDING